MSTGPSSCGVVQLATTSGDENEDDVMAMVLAPTLLLTGDWPDTSAKNFKPFSYYADLIKERNDEALAPEQIQMTLAAMDRCFGDKSVRKMSEAQIISNFGAPDQKMERPGWTIYVYRIQGGRYGERRLLRE